MCHISSKLREVLRVFFKTEKIQWVNPLSKITYIYLFKLPNPQPQNLQILIRIIQMHRSPKLLHPVIVVTLSSIKIIIKLG